MIPRQLREELGLRAGEVEVSAQGTSLRVDPIAGDSLEERDGRLIIPPSGAPLDDEAVRTLRDAGRR